MFGMGKTDGLFIIICFPANIIAKKRECNFSFGADDLAGIGGLVFGDIKTPRAIYNYLIFKQYLTANMVVGLCCMGLI